MAKICKKVKYPKVIIIYKIKKIILILPKIIEVKRVTMAKFKP